MQIEFSSPLRARGEAASHKGNCKKKNNLHFFRYLWYRGTAGPMMGYAKIYSDVRDQLELQMVFILPNAQTLPLIVRLHSYIKVKGCLSIPKDLSLPN